ncbi:MAG: GNAT family N-acetyltransferase [Verrucomicrobiota bacterium]|nr:GNAT family N-acetyltransferase [Verrucomicrobiota bacterium]
MITIAELTKSTNEALIAINHLLPQLSANAKGLSMDRLTELVESDNTLIFIGADENGSILGMLSLIVMKIPTCNKAWIEDVVVDQAARGKGLGKSLMNHALEQAKKLGAKSVDLTSRPSRESANKLYQALGYEIRETNVYRYKFS